MVFEEPKTPTPQPESQPEPEVPPPTQSPIATDKSVVETDAGDNEPVESKGVENEPVEILIIPDNLLDSPEPETDRGSLCVVSSTICHPVSHVSWFTCISVLCV